MAASISSIVRGIAADRFSQPVLRNQAVVLEAETHAPLLMVNADVNAENHARRETFSGRLTMSCTS